MISDDNEKQLSQLLAGGQEVHKRLKSALDLAQIDENPAIFYTRSRVKQSDSVKQKILDRQVRYGKNYSISNLTDIVGLRVVVLYDEYIPTALKWVLNALESTRHSSSPLLSAENIKDCIQEITAYRRKNSKSDPYQRCLKDLQAELGLGERVCKYADADDTHYSSLHLLLNLSSYHLGRESSVPVEVQVRTAIEDVWGEISHKTEYKAKPANVWSPGIQAKLETAKKTLGLLKSTIDGGLPETITQISESSKELQKEVEKCQELRRLSSGSIVIDQVFEIEEEPDADFNLLITKYREVLKSFKGSGKISAKIAVIDKLREVCGELGVLMRQNKHKHKTGSGLLEFESLRLQIISNRFKQDQLAAVHADDYAEYSGPLSKLALEIYEELAELDRSTDILLKSPSLFEYWLFMAARQAGLDEHSVRHLEAAVAALDADTALPSDSIIRPTIFRALAIRHWTAASQEALVFGYDDPSNMVFSLREFIASRFQMALGYELRSQRLEKKYQRSDLLYAKPQGWMGLNNRVLYAAECLRWNDANDFFSELGYAESSWLSDVEQLAKLCLEGEAATRRDLLHSLMMAYHVKGDSALAKEALDTLDELDLDSRWRRLGLLKRYEADKLLVEQSAPQSY